MTVVRRGLSKKYVPNLKKLQHICSRNYGLLLRLLPLEYHVQQHWLIQVSDTLSFELTVTEISKYTECFSLKQLDNHLPVNFKTNIDFRVYHDAQMVEVTGFQKQKGIRANNPYPNPKLHHKDEKYQINLLLKDWLNLVSEHQSQGKEVIVTPSVTLLK